MTENQTAKSIKYTGYFAFFYGWVMVIFACISLFSISEEDFSLHLADSILAIGFGAFLIFSGQKIKKLTKHTKGYLTAICITGAIILLIQFLVNFKIYMWPLFYLVWNAWGDRGNINAKFAEVELSK